MMVVEPWPPGLILAHTNDGSPEAMRAEPDASSGTRDSRASVQGCSLVQVT